MFKHVNGDRGFAGHMTLGEVQLYDYVLKTLSNKTVGQYFLRQRGDGQVTGVYLRFRGVCTALTSIAQDIVNRMHMQYPVFDVVPHSLFEPMSYRTGVK